VAARWEMGVAGVRATVRIVVKQAKADGIQAACWDRGRLRAGGG
jgi:hypothetical protein